MCGDHAFSIVKKEEVIYTAIYCRRKDGNTWHWRRNCSKWSKSDYVEEYHRRAERPSSGELDNERVKGKEEKCIT